MRCQVSREKRSIVVQLRRNWGSLRYRPFEAACASTLLVTAFDQNNALLSLHKFLTATMRRSSASSRSLAAAELHFITSNCPTPDKLALSQVENSLLRSVECPVYAHQWPGSIQISNRSAPSSRGERKSVMS